MYVDSEINALQKLLVHRPDSGIARIAPGNSDRLLFDDIVHLKRMQEEHRQYVEFLNFYLGEENVLDMADLLCEGLKHSPAIKEELLEKVQEFEEVPDSYRALMDGLSAGALSELLITGYLEEEDLYMFDPIPNLIFTRDIAVVIKDHVIITKAFKMARQRENLLTRFVFGAHPHFAKSKKEGKHINLNDINAFPPNKMGERVSIEGGDMMMLREDYLLVGVSERSSAHAFESLKEVLFSKELMKHMVQVKIPADRSFMHIDTLFTRLSESEMLAYKPIVMDGLSSWVKVYENGGETRKYQSIMEFFRHEIKKDMDFIPAGGGLSPYQEREQWTDACNILALDSGIGIAYDRNEKTAEELKKRGYSILHIEDALAKIKTGKAEKKDFEKTLIALNSTELSRARGGSHCMSCPIIRKKTQEDV